MTSDKQQAQPQRTQLVTVDSSAWPLEPHRFIAAGLHKCASYRYAVPWAVLRTGRSRPEDSAVGALPGGWVGIRGGIRVKLGAEPNMVQKQARSESRTAKGKLGRRYDPQGKDE